MRDKNTVAKNWALKERVWQLAKESVDCRTLLEPATNAYSEGFRNGRASAQLEAANHLLEIINNCGGDREDGMGRLAVGGS